MRFIEKIAKKHGKAFSALCLCVFLLMLLCNLLTGLFSDDYVYFCNFSTGERISSIFDVFPSAFAHAKIVNGRTVAHFILQVFLLLPTAVFDVINSLVFVILLMAICRSGAESSQKSPLIFAAVFSSVWLFTGDFGQVALWTDGACNYLFGAAAGVLFLIPYSREFLGGAKIKTIAGKIAFVLFGFVVGGYIENTSAAVIFISAALTVLSAVKGREKTNITNLLAIASAVCGFLFMMLAPAESGSKFGGLSIGDLRRGFITALEMLKSFRFVLFFLAALFVIAFHIKLSKEKILLAAVFSAGALLANFILIPASYYPPRASFFVLVLLLCACVVLTKEMLLSGARKYIIIAFAILFLCAVYYILIGVNDIYETHLLQKSNRELIFACKAAGEYDIRLPIISPKTKYSAVYELKYLDETDPFAWPNSSMASYYGVRSILGYR